MKTQSYLKTNKRRAIIIAIAGACIIILSVAAYLVLKKPAAPTNATDTTESQINYNPPTKEEVSTGETIKNESNQAGTDTSPGTTGTPSSLSIVSVNQDVSTVHIGTTIQTVTSDGTCVLTMTSQSGKTYTASAEVQAMPSYSTCKGFNVPVASLSTEKWTINVTYRNDTSTASATSSIEVQ